MKKEKTFVIVLLALILIGGGIFLMFFFDGNMSVDQTGTMMDRNDSTLQATTDQTATTNTNLKTQSASYLGRDGVYVVQYTDTGFVPKSLEIPQGKSIRFVNMSSKGLRVFTDSTDPKFTELNEAKTIGKGATYTFSFVTAGLWSYYNQVFPAHKASIAIY